MKKSTLIIGLLLCFSGTANAQFFKRLGKKVKKAAEKAVERKVEQKTTKETEKAFDSTFNNSKKKKKRKKTSIPGFSNVKPANSYAFNHKAVMQISSGKEVTKIDYYLPNTGSFFGMGIKDKRVKDDFMTVYDVEREAMFTFMQNAGKKIKMGIEFKTDDVDVDNTDFNITPTGNTKVILGYNCKEYKMSGKEMTATIWVTKEVDFRFPSVMYNGAKNKANNQQWMNNLDGWAMEMEMIDSSKRKPRTILMKCLSIEKSSLKIDSNNYQNIGY
ncbi:hypothetical protein LPB136_00875 [Tenacibaculum todarodis]|uniref:DUF4412 domain-containing protein n=1 Tax=Tenacibaculum todarodis TaxID=1850252 RepID=A0A1L3JFV2_9FLAO|nr:DUF4412 domain-containing protein [Tenacibaculum todarodis]APG64008.1 hypothetical protein LPB136_00875 [Tenacibaculum todarodis]